MSWYILVVRNGKHFFATRQYDDKHFVEELAEQLHNKWPDAKIELCYVSTVTTIDTLYPQK